MVSTLYIGQYAKAGKFITSQWEYFIEWCKTECDKIIVYSQMSYGTICAKFPLFCDINELERPDETLNVHAFKLNISNVAFWEYIKEYDYDIDIEDDISYIFFFYGERNVASLEIVDYENYILIEEPISQKDKFLCNRELISENIRSCTKGKSDINDLVQGDDWKPLGI